MSILLTLFAEKTVFPGMSDLDTLIKINLTLYEVVFYRLYYIPGLP